MNNIFKDEGERKIKSVLISIRPRWCELIASGKKTVEVRKTRPKLETPFKVYIYCTANKQGVKDLLEIYGTDGKFRKANGKVIGEFLCDKITMAFVEYDAYGFPSYWDILDGSCLTANELVCYGEWKTLYGWHISDLVIYDKPKELGEFKKPIMPTGLEYEDNTLTRPPQSWFSVEEVKDNG